MPKGSMAWGVAGLWLIAALPAVGQDADELLSSPRVRNYVSVGAPGAGLVICADVLVGQLVNSTNNGSCLTVKQAPLRYLGSAGREVIVVWPSFNPLQLEVATGVSTTPDAAAQQMAKIADLISDLGRGLAEGTFSKALEAGGVPRNRLENVVAGDTFLQKVLAYRDLLGTGVVSADEVKGWVSGATGKAGVQAVRRQMAGAAERLAQHFTRVDEALDQVEAAATTPVEKSIAASLRVAAINDPLRDKKALKRAIEGLSQSLESFETRRWEGDALVLDSIGIDAGQESIDKVTATTVTVELKDGALQRKVGKPSSVELRFRAFRRLVPEGAVGAVYTGLTKPVYKAVKDGDLLRVRRGEDQKVGLGGAAVTNLVIRGGGTPALNPMLQIGVSSGAELPALLLGGGFRFRGKAPVSVSGGLVLSWLKDLDQLHPNDPVASDLDIEGDLKRKLRASWYAGVQYKF